MSRLVYLGTPELAVPPLHALVNARHEVVLVVTRPDRRRGRGKATSPSPVKAAALALGLTVTDRLADVPGAGAELGVVVAFGRIIPPDILAAVPMINVHFSLLPRWRGAAPVERAILAGDEVTGVCVMAVEEGLDTGAVYAQQVVAIGEESLSVLRDRLVAVGSDLVVRLLANGVGALPEPRPQEGEPVYAEKIRPDEYELDWSQPADDLARVVRLGRAFTTFRNRRLAVLEARPLAEVPEVASGASPGTVVEEVVVAGAGALELGIVQPEGSRSMAAADWRRGAHLVSGEQMG